MGKLKLWSHQQKIVDKAAESDCMAVFAEMGVGKTACTIAIRDHKCAQERRQLRTLIVAPTVVTYVWKRELARFSELNNSYVLVLRGTAFERRKQLERTPNYFVVIMNYESLLMDVVFKAIKDWGPEFIVADESHRLKNIKAQRTKRLLALSAQARFKYILSGTPITNSEADLFSQYLFMDDGQTFGKSYFTFRNLWFTDANRQIRQFSPAVKWPKWEPKPHRAEEFRQKVMAKAVSVTKSECMDLPPYIQSSIEVGMSLEQQRAYKEMKDEFLVFIKSSAFTAELAVTKALRLLQITAGFIQNTEGKIHQFLNTPKDKAVLEIIESTANKVVLWTPWRASQQNLRDLMKRHKINYRELVGDSGAEERDHALRDFADDDKVQVMLASQGAAGVGISLVSADTAIYYGRNFSFEQDSQSAARIHRGGSERWDKVYRMDLVIPDTIDVSCMEAVTRKEELKDAIINSHLKV